MTKFSIDYDSPLEIFYTNMSKKIAPHLKNLNASPNDITTAGLMFNFCALFSLCELNFVLFLIFLFMGHMCDTLDGVYARMYNKETLFGHFYDHIADGIKVISLAYAFYTIYYRHMDNFSMGLIYFIFLMCNVHFVVKHRLYDLEGKEVDLTRLVWVKIGSFTSNTEMLRKVAKITKYFDEASSILYISLLFSILHYRLLYL